MSEQYFTPQGPTGTSFQQSEMTDRERAIKATRAFWIWHMHLGKYGDQRAMICIEIPCTALWFWY